MGETELVSARLAEVLLLARLLEAEEPRPRAMVYARYSDTRDAVLLVVPATTDADPRENYRRIARLMANRRRDFPSIDIADVQIVDEDQPYIRALSTAFRADSFSTITIDRSVFAGVYIEFAIIFLMALTGRSQLAS